MEGSVADVVFGLVRNLLNREWPHYWAVVTYEGERIVVDVSADQFGLPVLVLGSESTVASHKRLRTVGDIP
jgi:hypothetical protein